MRAIREHDWYEGLSPRVRGIPGEVGFSDLDAGSIPACTGNPSVGDCVISRNWVYPRVYGESNASEELRLALEGLSPRVRGIRHAEARGIERRGSIPACTGNPRPTTARTP